MTFKLIYKAKNILHFVFPSPEEMCQTMLRFAEHYESPEFRNKIFTLEEFKAWYSKGKAFTYYSDWGGYNIPGYAFDAFKQGLFQNISKEEQEVIDVLPKDSNFYVIATDEGYQALRHETAHAFYYLDEQYKKQIQEILKNAPNIEIPFEYLRDMGYCDEVLLDEVHAYLNDGIKLFCKYTKIIKRLGLVAYIKYWILSRKIRKVFNKTYDAYSK